MITSEFNSAVAKQDLLMVRIMLKDSFVIDPSLRQFKEMFQYANGRLPTLLVPYDGEPLESDCRKWDKKALNMELVKLVNNFSRERINHLRSVVSHIYAPQLTQNQVPPRTTTTPTNSVMVSGHGAPVTTTSNKSPDTSQKAIQQMQQEAERITRIYQQAIDTKTWSVKNIDDMERSAKALLNAICSYKQKR